MGVNTIDALIEGIKGRPAKKIAVAAAEDAGVLRAVLEAYEDGVVEPILVGDAERIKALLDERGVGVPGKLIVNAESAAEAAEKAVTMVRSGEADILMKGLMQTADMMRPVVNKERGLNVGSVISLVSIMEIPGYHKLLTVTDCGITANPTLEQKRGILENAVKVLSTVGIENPKVAVLSASETVNPKIPDSADALKLTEMNRSGEIVGCMVEGPISMDIALSEHIAQKKHYESQIAGDVDVLLMPNVLAGNLAVKLLGRFVDVKTVSVVAGASAPIVLTSRGTSPENKYRAICLAAAAAGRK